MEEKNGEFREIRFDIFEKGEHPAKPTWMSTRVATRQLRIYFP